MTAQFRNIRISISVWFAAVIMLLCIFAPEGSALTGLLCSLAHETGHLIFIKVFGAKVKSLSLGVYGMRIECSGNLKVSHSKEAVISFAGPAVNILLSLAALIIHYTRLFYINALLAVSFVCASAVHAAETPASGPAPKSALVLATDYAAADGVTDVADALQRCIDENPHRTIYFPDGEYLLSHPIATPADPARAVTLRLADFAFLKAAPGWAHTNAMVRLGARAPANNNRAPGSV